MGRKSNSTTYFIESDVSFITKPLDIGNYLNYHFISEVCKLREEIPKSSCEPSYLCIKDQLMKDKNCTFERSKVGVEKVKKLWLSINNEKNHLVSTATVMIRSG